MYYHEIKTVLRLNEFGIHDRLLICQITKIVITHIQYAFQWDFPYKTKVAKGDPYINSDCDEVFLGNHFLSSKGKSSGDTRVFIRISCFLPPYCIGKTFEDGIF